MYSESGYVGHYVHQASFKLMEICLTQSAKMNNILLNILKNTLFVLLGHGFSV